MNTKSPGPLVNEIDWLTPRTREILLLAQQEAAQAGRPSIQPEHLLLGVILQGESKAATLLNKSGLDEGTLRTHTQEASAGHLSSTEPSPPLSQAAQGCIEQAIAMISYYSSFSQSRARTPGPQHYLSSQYPETPGHISHTDSCFAPTAHRGHGT
jgi:ATP-dependent Clp protease ATP-binding subunit ClpA